MPKMMEYYTGLTGYQIVEEFERELSPDYHGQLFRWMDEKFDRLFSREATTFDKACDEFMVSEKGFQATQEFARARARYFRTLIEKAEEFRKLKGLDESKQFLDSLGTRR